MLNSATPSVALKAVPTAALISRWKPIDLHDERVATGHRRMLDRRAARLDAGAQSIGWKIGWNEPTTQSRLGIESCALGYLLAETLATSDESIDLNGTRLVGIEPELGIVMAADLDEHATLDEIDRSIASVCLAVEVIDINARFDDLAGVLAGNIWHHSYVFGPLLQHAWVPSRLDDATVLVTRNEQLAMIPVEAGEAIGDVRLAASFVASSLAKLGQRLRRGEVVLSGVLTPLPIWVKPGDRTVVSMGCFGEVVLDFHTSDTA